MSELKTSSVLEMGEGHKEAWQWKFNRTASDFDSQTLSEINDLMLVLANISPEEMQMML